MGQNQMLKDFRVKRENIIRLGTGRNNKMATGRSSSTQPFTPALDRRLLASLAWLKRKEKMIWHWIKKAAKLHWPGHTAAIPPSIRSWQVMVSYSVTEVKFKRGGDDHHLLLSQEASIRLSTPLNLRRKHREKKQEADHDGLLQIVSWNIFLPFWPLYSLYIQYLQYRQEAVRTFSNKKPFLQLPTSIAEHYSEHLIMIVYVISNLARQSL
jgi:hypothetical protein